MFRICLAVEVGVISAINKMTESSQLHPAQMKRLIAIKVECSRKTDKQSLLAFNLAVHCMQGINEASKRAPPVLDESPAWPAPAPPPRDSVPSRAPGLRPGPPS